MSETVSKVAAFLARNCALAKSANASISTAEQLYFAAISGSD